MIDELETVRRLGADDAAPDPAARERVRACVLHDPRRPAPRRRRRLWSVAVLAPVAAAALAVAMVLTPNQDGGDFSGDRSGTGVLPSLFPAPDEFLYVRSRGRSLECGDPGERCTLDAQRVREVWLSERRRGRIVVRPVARRRPSDARVGPVPLRLGDRRFSHDELARWAPTGGELLQLLQRYRVPGVGDGGASYPFRQITDALSEMAMPPRVRRAMLEALPRIPGVESLGEMTDAEGRQGLGYSRLVEGQREAVLVDPNTATLLGQRTIVAAPGVVRGFDVGDEVGRATYLERAVVRRAGARR